MGAESQLACRPLVAVGPDFLVFRGRLWDLDWHHAGAPALLVTQDEQFEIETAKLGRQRVHAALVGAGIRHRLDFAGGTAAVFYFDPHHRLCPVVQHVGRGVWNTAQALRPGWREAWSLEDPRRASVRWQELCEAEFAELNAESGAPRLAELLGPFAGLNAREALDQSMSELAAQAGLSPSRLTHVIKQAHDCGLRRIKQYYRFKLAAQGLAGGLRSFTEAAIEAGFSDSAHFSRAHRDMFGGSPRQIHVGDIRWVNLTG